MKVNYATIINRQAYLSSDYGLSFAIKVTGMDEATIESMVGRYKRGPRKGLLRGKLAWLEVIKGGWIKTGSYDHDEGRSSGFVCRYSGIKFCFGIQLEVFRGEDKCLWGNCEGDSAQYRDLITQMKEISNRQSKVCDETAKD